MANSRAHIEYERKQAEADLRKSSSSLAEKIRDLSRKQTKLDTEDKNDTSLNGKAKRPLVMISTKL